MVLSMLALTGVEAQAQVQVQATSCPASGIDVATADANQLQGLNGMNAGSSKALLRLRRGGSINSMDDLRQLRINDRRFLRLVTDGQACFGGRLLNELLPSAVCVDSHARINTSPVKALAERVGWKSARRLVKARNIGGYNDIIAIPEWGKKILGRLARKGGTCLDPVSVAATTFGPGRHVVGEDITAGRYVAANVIDCVWERSSGPTGGAATRLASGRRDAALQVVVDIDMSDSSFASTGCGTWNRLDTASLNVLAAIPGDGDWLVSDQVAPGLYRASDATNCSWARSAGLSGFNSDVLQTGALVSNSVLVDVLASDAAFTSQDCGSWLPVASACVSQLDAVYPAQPEVAPHIYGVSDSVLLSTQYEIGLTLDQFTVNWGGFGGLNTPNSPQIVEIEIGEGKVTGSTVIVGLGHNYRGVMEPNYPGYIDSLMDTFPDHVDRVIWVTPSRFNTLMPFVVGQLNEATERWPQLEIADFWIEADAQNHPEWYNDDIHLDVEGRQVMADYLNDKLLNPCG